MTQVFNRVVLYGCLLIITGCGHAQLRNDLSKQTAPDNEPATAALKNDFGMDFILVPSGSFDMGSPATETGRDQDERLHNVTISQDFYLQRTEVTQGQWRAVMGNNPSFFLNCGDQCPVEQVSWVDVQQFITKLNQTDPTLEYRLPTEAEWEYAARAGSTTALPNGELAGDKGAQLFHDAQVDQLAWYVGNSEEGTHPVGQKQPNAWGLVDMHGNVQEWVEDWHNTYPFNDVADPIGPEQGLTKIRRGGSWNLYARLCRSASRSWGAPTLFDPFTGLRLIASPKPPKPAPVKPVVESVAVAPAATSWEIFFDLDSDLITPPMHARLSDILTVVKDSSSVLILEGHTCDLAPDEYNQKLSERRAAAVKRFFLKHGIAENRVRDLAFGEQNPGYPNDSSNGRQLNRRVVIHLQ